MMSKSSTSVPLSNKRRKVEDETAQVPVAGQKLNEELIRLREAWKSSSPAILLPAISDRGSGIGRLKIDKDLSECVMPSLIELHDRVSNYIPSGVTWGEGRADEDPRRRRYAFLPTQRQKLLDSGIRVQAEGMSDNQEHNFAMSSKVSIDIIWQNHKSLQQQQKQQAKTNNGDVLECTMAMFDALREVTTYIQSLVSEKYKKYVTMDKLVAVQPNHHNGALFLPAHLDFPRADGFGVVIATVCIRNTNGSKVILIDDGDEGEERVSWSLNLENGDCYFLSNDSRNKCLHGILSETNGYRETLNLRYGLHSKRMAQNEIEQYWPSC